MSPRPSRQMLHEFFEKSKGLKYWNLKLVKGSVPGSKNSFVLIQKTTKVINRATVLEKASKIKTEEIQMLPTASFLAMAEKLEMAIDIDKLIIDSSLELIKTRNFTEKFFGINVTASSAHSDQFVLWLERRLLKDANIASKLIFEVSEFGLQQNIKASKRFIEMVHRVGARITVERFGVGLTSF